MHTTRWLALPVLALVTVAACTAPEDKELGPRNGLRGEDETESTIERTEPAVKGEDADPHEGTDSVGPEEEGPEASAPMSPAPEPAIPAMTFASACPTEARLSQGFKGAAHDGIDLANVRGTPIFATGAGVVVASGPAQGYGQWIRIKHDDGSMTEYGHMFQRDVQVGAKVTAGQQIALMGSEGQSTGPHLHLRTYKDANVIGAGKGMNPVDYLKERGLTLPCKKGDTGKSGGGPAPAGSVTAWKAADVRDCPKTTCAVVGQAAASNTYAATCFAVGESVTADGYTNDKWVKLSLPDGKAGFISAINLKGDETGGVKTACPAP